MNITRYDGFDILRSGLLTAVLVVAFSGITRGERPPAEPLTAAQGIKAFDVHQFAAPPNAEEFRRMGTQLSYVTSSLPGPAMEWVRTELTSAGFAAGRWHRIKEASIQFESDAHAVNVRLESEAQSRTTHVTALCQSAIDLQQIFAMPPKARHDYTTVAGQSYFPCDMPFHEAMQWMTEEAGKVKGQFTMTQSQMSHRESTYFTNGTTSLVAFATRSSRQTEVLISNVGATDVQQLPMPQRLRSLNDQSLAEGRHDFAAFESEASLDEFLVNCVEAFEQSGYTLSRSHLNPSEGDGWTDLRFFRNATYVDVMAHALRSGHTRVYYKINLQPFDLPTEWVTGQHTHLANDYGNRYGTTADMDTVIRFYEQHLTQAGWQKLDTFQQRKGDEAKLAFDGVLDHPVLLELWENDGVTTVQICRMSEEQVAERFGIAQASDQGEVTADDFAEIVAVEESLTVEERLYGNQSWVHDFPIPKDARQPRRDAFVASISYQAEALDPQINFYRRQLKQRGWTLTGEQVFDRSATIVAEKDRIQVRIVITDDESSAPSLLQVQIGFFPTATE